MACFCNENCGGKPYCYFHPLHRLGHGTSRREARSVFWPFTILPSRLRRIRSGPGRVTPFIRSGTSFRASKKASFRIHVWLGNREGRIRVLGCQASEPFQRPNNGSLCRYRSRIILLIFKTKETTIKTP